MQYFAEISMSTSRRCDLCFVLLLVMMALRMKIINHDGHRHVRKSSILLHLMQKLITSSCNSHAQCTTWALLKTGRDKKDIISGYSKKWRSILRLSMFLDPRHPDSSCLYPLRVKSPFGQQSHQNIAKKGPRITLSQRQLRDWTWTGDGTRMNHSVAKLLRWVEIFKPKDTRIHRYPHIYHRYVLGPESFRIGTSCPQSKNWRTAKRSQKKCTSNMMSSGRREMSMIFSINLQ